MYEVTLREQIDEPWLSMGPVRLGTVPSGLGTPALFALVLQDGKPVLRVDVHGGTGPFTQAIIWCGALVVGFGDHVHFVDLATHKTESIALHWYFGHLYESAGLIVADAERLLCFEAPGRLKWSSKVLGIDGVTVHTIDGGIIHGVGEWDPGESGGERPFAIRLDIGEPVALEHVR